MKSLVHSVTSDAQIKNKGPLCYMKTTTDEVVSFSSKLIQYGKLSCSTHWHHVLSHAMTM